MKSPEQIEQERRREEQIAESDEYGAPLKKRVKSKIKVEKPEPEGSDYSQKQ